MIIELSPEIESLRNYVQTLCMSFFPLERYSSREGALHLSRLAVRCSRSGDRLSYSCEFTLLGQTSGAMGSDRLTGGATAQTAIGNLIYNCLSSHTGYSPPWGTLTGIRPTKKIAEYVAKYPDDALRRFCGDYNVDPAKASLAYDTYLGQNAIASGLGERTCSLYISIPFCPTRCGYCSFTSFSTPRLKAMIPEYLKRLRGEVVLTLDTIRRLGLELRTIYVGGGTPTILEASQLEELLSVPGELGFDPAALEEFTVEAGRPDTVTPDKLAALRRAGVGRISINPQTKSDEVLKAIGRGHTWDDFLRAYEQADRAGFGVINSDLIAGLPGDTREGYLSSLRAILDLGAKNITQHVFCAKRSAELRDSARAAILTNREVNGTVDAAHAMLRGSGYTPYYMYRQKYTAQNLENTGYQKGGTPCLYNIYMMEELHSVFSAGAGGVTKLVSPDRKRIERFSQMKYPYEYLTSAYPLENERNKELLQSTIFNRHEQHE